MRTYDDEVAVRTRDDGSDGVEPDAFVWRGRLYAVHLVLDRWVQRRPWWRLAFETPTGSPTGSATGSATGSPSEGPSGALQATRVARGYGADDQVACADGQVAGADGDVLTDVEEDVWRVEAAVGRARDVRLQAGYGVYDLVRSGTQWRLATVSD